MMNAPEESEPIYQEREVEGRTCTVVYEWCESYWHGVSNLKLPPGRCGVVDHRWGAMIRVHAAARSSIIVVCIDKQQEINGYLRNSVIETKTVKPGQTGFW